MTAEFHERLEGWVPNRALTINARNRTHWQVIRKHKDAAKEMVSLAVRPRFMADKSQRFGWAQVAITFGFPSKRRRDPDNLAGMVKPILDALVAEGILVDDDCDHIELLVRGQAVGRYFTDIFIVGRLVSEGPQQIVLMPRIGIDVSTDL